jgi:hypothetical protein
VVIRRSSRVDVQELVAELRASSLDEARREITLARLAVIGKRAVSRILDGLTTARTADEEIAFLLALERVPDERAVQPLVTILTDRSSRNAPDRARVRTAAVRAARPLLDLETDGTTILDCLTGLILDATESSDLRCAALETLSELPAATLKPLNRRLRDDPDPVVRTYAAGKRKPPADVISQATEGESLPEDPDAALSLVGRIGREAPLSTLHTLLNAVRAREAGRRQSDWQAVRGAIHLALASRDSRVALYDLRESFERVESHPLPADFLEAVRRVGDDTLLEPLARAWMAASDPAQRKTSKAWGRDVRSAFLALLKRERPATRIRTIGRLEKRWKTAEAAARLRELWGAESVKSAKRPLSL